MSDGSVQSPLLRHAVNDQSTSSPWRFKVEGTEKCPCKGHLVRARQIGNRVRCPMCDNICVCPKDVEHDQQIKIDKF